MPDTGLPWEIPYAAPADLVRDWPALSEDVADAVAAGLSAAVLPGIGSNVVQTVETDIESASTAGGSSNALGPTVTITPQSSTSKILVLAEFNVSASTPIVYGWLQRDEADSAYIGDTAGNRRRVSTVSANTSVSQINIMYLDSPATTSAVTYRLVFRHGSSATQTIYLNRRGDSDADDGFNGRFASSITAIEVKA
jgi:hypothetical protein